MLSALKKLVGTPPKQEAPVECVFSLSPNKRKLYLLDLKAILRTTDARLALPNVVNLEFTLMRNHERIRIPYPAMLALVRELLSVRHRIPKQSPLVDIMSAIPGLVNTAMTLPAAQLPVSGPDAAIRVGGIPRDEQEAEVARIRDMIAERRRSKEAKRRPAPSRTVAPAAIAPPGAVAATRAPATLPLGMTAPGQHAHLEHGAELIETLAMSTIELSDHDLAGYVDLCILNGDHERVIAMLEERVAEQPRAWIWVRLMELAEAARHPHFAELRDRFRQWARDAHPELIPADENGAELLFFGLKRDPLRRMERDERGMHASD
jgi:hypothetical protein